MSKIRRADFVARHQGRSVDLHKLENNSDAQTQIQDAGLTIAEMRSADRDGDGKVDAKEAFRFADGLDSDGSYQSLFAEDASGLTTPAGNVLNTMDLLLNHGDLQPAPTPSVPQPSAPTGNGLLDLGNDLRGHPSHFNGGALHFDPGFLDSIEANHGPRARARLEEWRDLFGELDGKSPEFKINRVDSFFKDRVVYVRDRNTAGQSDYWQSPIETLATGKGDCEDYALGKYATLRQLGFSGDDVKLAVVKTAAGETHAVTLADPKDGQGRMVMDNQRFFPVRLVDRGDLIPIFDVHPNGLQTLDMNWQPRIPFRLSLGQMPAAEDGMVRSASVLPAP
jgi:predicted transglutaminase-like cysteine proteinase